MVYQAHMREATIKNEVVAELGKRDVREAAMLAEGNLLQQRLALAALRQRLAAADAELTLLRQQAQRVDLLEDMVRRLLPSVSRNPVESGDTAPPSMGDAGTSRPIGPSHMPAGSGPPPKYAAGGRGNHPLYSPSPYGGGGGGFPPSSDGGGDFRVPEGFPHGRFPGLSLPPLL